MDEIIKMTPDQLKSEVETATKSIQDTLDAKEKELETVKADANSKEEVTKSLQKEIDDLKLEQKTLKDKQLTEKQSQGIFHNPNEPIKVKAKKVNELGAWGVLQGIAMKENRNVMEVAKSYYETSKDETIPAVLNYMKNSLQSSTTTEYNTFMDRVKSIGLADLVSGGELAAPDVEQSDYIELLRPLNTVQGTPSFRRIGLVNGQAKINGTLTGTNAYHVGSNATLTPDNMTFRQIKFSAKKVAAFSVIDNDLLRLGDANIYNIVSQDLIEGITSEWDRGIILGEGSNFEPVGLVNIAGGSFARTSTPDSIKIGKDLRKAIKTLQNANSRLVAPVWYMRPAMKTAIEDQYSVNKDQMGYAARLESDGLLMGFPVVTTNNIPSGANNVVILMDTADFVIANGYALTVDTSDQRYFDSDQTAIRGIWTYDTAIRNVGNICKITTVDDWETT